ncbi:MAG: metallophosphoesterase [Verrucomicrobia bacterium]|nr:metallophosphoesterase [Verrucomicrobiota bacterium]
MPITLPSISRRRWIKGSLAAALAPVWSKAQEADNAETWVLFSDTHIAADKTLEVRGVIMGENLSRCVNQVLKIGQKPFGVLINGDVAYLDGQQGDYDTFLNLISPLRESAVQVHCTLGNHDDRKNFIAAMTSPQDPRPVEGRHVEVLSSATMNWVLLDSLLEINKTPGQLGEAQLGWLDRTLSAAADKPTVVMSHHNPQGPVPEGKKLTGLLDSDALFTVLAKHKKVKALIYGHTHTWEHQMHDATGIHLINLPPVAYVFNQARPNGWVIAKVTAEKLELELRALNPAHEKHGEKIVVSWAA